MQWQKWLNNPTTPIDIARTTPIANAAEVADVFNEDAWVENAVLKPASYSSKQLFLMQFGAYGTTYLFVWADHLEDALKESVEWLDDNAPGHLTDVTEDDLKESAEDLGIAWEDHWPDWNDRNFEKVVEHAEADLYVVGHTTLKNGQYLESDWWGGEVTNPEEFNIVARRSFEEAF